MDAAEAIADLLELSSQVEAAVLLEASGGVEASSFADAREATALARRAVDLVAAAGGLRRGVAVEHVEARGRRGGLVVVQEGERLAAATTVAGAPAALVVYDLRTALRSSAPQAAPAPKRRRKAKAASEVEADA